MDKLDGLREKLEEQFQVPHSKTIKRKQGP